jgi:hypothetical protein
MSTVALRVNATSPSVFGDLTPETRPPVNAAMMPVAATPTAIYYLAGGFAFAVGFAHGLYDAVTAADGFTPTI